MRSPGEGAAADRAVARPQTRLLTRAIGASELPYLRWMLGWVTVIAMLDAVTRTFTFASDYAHPRGVLACLVGAAALPFVLPGLRRLTGSTAAAATAFGFGLFVIDVGMLVAVGPEPRFGATSWAPSTLGILTLALLVYRPIRAVVLLGAAHAGTLAVGALLRHSPPGLADLGAIASAVVLALLAPVGAGSMAAALVGRLRVHAAMSDAAEAEPGELLRSTHEAGRARLTAVRARARRLLEEVADGRVPVPVPDEVARRARRIAQDLRDELVRTQSRSWATALAQVWGPGELLVVDPERELDRLDEPARAALHRLLVAARSLRSGPGDGIVLVAAGSLSISIPVGRAPRGPAARALTEALRAVGRGTYAVTDGILLVDVEPSAGRRGRAHG